VFFLKPNDSIKGRKNDTHLSDCNHITHLAYPQSKKDHHVSKEDQKAKDQNGAFVDVPFFLQPRSFFYQHIRREEKPGEKEHEIDVDRWIDNADPHLVYQRIGCNCPASAQCPQGSATPKFQQGLKKGLPGKGPQVNYVDAENDQGYAEDPEEKESLMD